MCNGYMFADVCLLTWILWTQVEDSCMHLFLQTCWHRCYAHEHPTSAAEHYWEAGKQGMQNQLVFSVAGHDPNSWVVSKEEAGFQYRRRYGEVTWSLNQSWRHSNCKQGTGTVTAIKQGSLESNGYVWIHPELGVFHSPPWHVMVSRILPARGS
jgi:hypothetical protein